MTISLYHLTCHCRWQSSARLPDYAGSTLRGAFGWALKRCACMLKSQDCPDCILNKNCAYAFLFATEIYTDGASHSVNARPHPLVIRPEANCAGDGREGEPFQFSLLLIGGSKEFLPHIVYSIKLMGEAGIGAGVKHGVGRFALEQVVANGQTIFAAASGLLDNTAPARVVNALTAWGRDISQLRVRFLTPLRLKKENNLADALPFQELIRATLRRISALESAYGNERQGEPALDYRGLVERAAAVRLARSSLRWRELRRFSNRQRQEVSLSGLIGEAVYEGNLTEFVPLLIYASQVNVGKQTLFGLGRMEIELFENRD